ncbi:MAG: hypothetical protein MJ237_06110 [bacterium]|nr:hypothetical protein [bacterium]
MNPMLVVQVSPRRTKYVKFTDDTKPNVGGYFCQVYEDANGEFECDTFTIDKSEVRGGKTDAERLRLAKMVANNRVKYMYAR